MQQKKMYNNIEHCKNISSAWFRELRDKICNEFESIDGAHFERKLWQREGGGGGEISIMRGNVFEKVGVNISTVWGEFDQQFRKEIPGAEDNPAFWASGISLVAHLKSPHVPPVHMNTRMIVTSKSWFGGGSDLNPIFEITEDSEAFHQAFKAACDKYNPEYYPKFKKWADEYFFIKHRNEPRGIGGIFYDYINTGDFAQDFGFTQDVGLAFLDIYPKLIRKNLDKTWTPDERRAQLEKRGRYTEFNLIYDRGTKFGLMTGGNIEAILMSLPPEAAWA
jgi:coproporphyrinogen III oxidase